MIGYEQPPPVLCGIDWTWLTVRLESLLAKSYYKKRPKQIWIVGKHQSYQSVARQPNRAITTFVFPMQAGSDWAHFYRTISQYTPE
jgi:hypothetical protein